MKATDSCAGGRSIVDARLIGIFADSSGRFQPDGRIRQSRSDQRLLFFACAPFGALGCFVGFFALPAFAFPPPALLGAGFDACAEFPEEGGGAVACDCCGAGAGWFGTAST